MLRLPLGAINFRFRELNKNVAELRYYQRERRRAEAYFWANFMRMVETDVPDWGLRICVTFK